MPRPPTEAPPEPGPTKASAPAAAAAPAPALALAVQPKKPRLAWSTMDHEELAASVPVQVVEIVRPARAQAANVKGAHAELGGTSQAGLAAARDEEPAGRLIWTNDNLVALQTLLEEKDAAGAFRYRGKVDLVYIDPPFMVNSDFRADNAIDIELDEAEGVQAKKEPSLVEILAYKDTWRQGLDSFLSTLRARLLLLKQLLAPTGSIYVHLDWHAVHYVKVMMDELFGYENFQSEVVWKRTSARSDANGFNHVHDTILSYSNGAAPWWSPVFGPYSAEYIRSHYNYIDEKSGRRYRTDNLRSPSPRPNLTYDYKGYRPHKNGWSIERPEMERLDAQGLIYFPPNGERLALKRFLDDDGMPLMSTWTDVPPVNSQAGDRLGYPTQKPVALLERIISASCPPGGLVLDCFMGSGTTCEAAERLGRRYIGIDNGKYALHLARKRLIQLHGQPKKGKAQYDYVECEHCKNIERKEKPQRLGKDDVYKVRPFTMENMGVYQRAERWEDFQTQASRYRDEMIKVFGGEPANQSMLLHGRKGSAWVHVGPLDGPIAAEQVWRIAREAKATSTKAVTILSADFDAVASETKAEIEEATGVRVTIRAIPAAALDEVRRRMEIARKGEAVESMAVPAFYAPLSITLARSAKGKLARLVLQSCEIDLDSFLASQRPVLKALDAGTEAQRKKAAAEHKKWKAREEELNAWLKKAKTWQAFIDFWAVDWDYGRRVGPDGKPVFVADWQSFRTRRGKGEADALVFEAEKVYPEPGLYRVAARVTDVFGNDGIATVQVEVK